ncbi:protein of unknown function (DUF4803) [Popillia japonica]|uniref:Uncharacterized protein n=1 Tax=Popillia japonica TaxID=7064 RepID=A0AAW1MML3_POPJA
MQICLAPTGTSRRYNYIEYKNHNALGAKSTCPTPPINVDAWIGWCPYCMCFCDDEGYYSDRYFSLKHAIRQKEQNNTSASPARGNTTSRRNKLQVQQGEILPQGVINVTSLEWVPVNNFKVNDRFIYNGQDYLKMTWKDKSVDLHVIEVDNKNQHQQRVLTGVRFSAVKSGMNRNDKRIHLNLEIRMTKFHFESGKLFVNRGAHAWGPRNLNTEFSPRMTKFHFESGKLFVNRGAHAWGPRNLNTEFSPNPRTKIPTNDLDIPTRTKSKNTIVSKGDQGLKSLPTI